MSKKILYQGKYIRLVSDNDWEFVERTNCKGIVIILSMREDNVLIFVEQYRAPVGRNVIEFPAGLVSDIFHGEESVEAAALRELEEETGYQAERVEHVATGPVNTGLSADVYSFYRAFGLKKVGPGGGDKTENIRVHEVPLAQAESWLHEIQTRGIYVDPKVYAGLFFLTRNG